MKSLATSFLALAALAGTTHAQCTLLRYGVPDFDQKRNALPNNGSYYCVPTSFTNLRGYIANHGYGSIMGGGGNWQSSANYNYVTARIDAIGDYMDTSSTGGTSPGDAADGWEDFIDDWHEDKFTLSWWTGYIPPLWLYTGMSLGLSNVCYGYYKPQGGGEYDRDGGHCVTLVGLKGLCSNFNEPTLRIKNPSTDDSINSQSTFSSQETRTDRQTFNYDGDLATRHRLTDFGSDSSTRRYLDRLFVIWPQIGLSGGVSRSGDFHVYRPVKVFGLNGDDSSSQSPSPGMDIKEIALHPMQTEAYALKINPATNQNRIYKQDLGNGEWSSVRPTFDAPDAHMAISRFGHMFVYANGLITKYDLNDGAYPALAERTSPGPIVDMEYDDLNDELVAITSTGRFLRFDNGLLLPAVNEPLPGGVALPGDGSVYPDPTTPDRWYVCSSDSPTMYRLTPVSTTTPRLRVDATINFPVGTEPRSLVMTDNGHLVFSDRGQFADWKFTEFSTHAAWVPYDGSDLAGLPAGRTVVVSRSRSNFVAGVHDQPKWQDDTYEEEGVPEVPDCNPDLNMDGDVDILDFLLFIDSFSECDGEPAPCGINAVNADYEVDGAVDILDFLTFIDDFSYGCD
jgi:hypothetical protein